MTPSAAVLVLVSAMGSQSCHHPSMPRGGSCCTGGPALTFAYGFKRAPSRETFRKRVSKAHFLILELGKNDKVVINKLDFPSRSARRQRFHQPRHVNHPLGFDFAHVLTALRSVLGRTYPAVFKLNKYRHEKPPLPVKYCWMPLKKNQ